VGEKDWAVLGAMRGVDPWDLSDLSESNDCGDDLAGDLRKLIDAEMAWRAEKAAELARREKAPAPITAFGPFVDPSACEHRWKRHLWDTTLDYCPHCTTERWRGP
jgi:hypothetical protein